MTSQKTLPQSSLFQRSMAKITDLSYPTLFLLWAGMAVGFGVAYFLLNVFANEHGPTLPEGDLPSRFWNSLYYSIITATSIGYGDIVPHGFSKTLASAQGILALFVFAIFVTKLVTHRQELALQEVHKLTFEDIFHNTREDLYIIRKDFDRIMQEAKRAHDLSPQSWDNLATAFEQAQILVREIPDFYEEGSKLYIIDAQRERLLIEALHRTLHRINAMLDVLSVEKIDWISQQSVMEALRELIHVIDATMPVWQKRSPYEHEEAFEDVVHLRESIHTRIAGALPGSE